MAQSMGDYTNTRGNDQPQRRREAIHAIEKIHGIGAGHQPADRQRKTPPAQFDHEADDFDSFKLMAGEHQRKHSQELSEQFPADPQTPLVVAKPNQASHAGREHQRRR